MQTYDKPGIPFKDCHKGRNLNQLHANELRAKLIAAGVKYTGEETKEDLVNLVKKHKL
nr:MAG TPA: Putative stress-responsive nuclear envelope protein [Caudoviricetes sp.]